MSPSSMTLRSRLSSNLRSGGLAVALVAIIALFFV